MATTDFDMLLEVESAADADLLLRTAKQDHIAFTELYDRYAPRTLGVIRRVLYDEHLANDTLQTVMFELWNRHAARYNPVLGSVDAWILRLARSRAIDEVRKGAVRKAHSLDQAGLDVRLDKDEQKDSEQSAQIRSALDKLDPTEATPVVMAFVHGMTRDEIATQLGIPIGTVKTRIRRAMIQLKSELSPAQTKGGVQ